MDPTKKQSVDQLNAARANEVALGNSAYGGSLQNLNTFNALGKMGNGANPERANLYSPNMGNTPVTGTTPGMPAVGQTGTSAQPILSSGVSSTAKNFTVAPTETVKPEALMGGRTNSSILDTIDKYNQQIQTGSVATDKELSIQAQLDANRQKQAEASNAIATTQDQFQRSGKLTTDIAQNFTSDLAKRSAYQLGALGATTQSLTNQLQQEVSKRTQGVDAAKLGIQGTKEYVGILSDLQKLTQPDLVGSPQVNDLNGDVNAFYKDPQTGKVTIQKIGNVGAKKQFIQTGTFTNENGDTVFFGVSPDNKVTTQNLNQANTGSGKTVATTTGSYDLSTYATDPNHANAIQQIMESSGVLNSPASISNFISQTVKNAPVTGDMIFNAASQNGVDPTLLTALLKQESQFGTAGAGAKTNNPGNVGNVDSGATRTYPSFKEGVNAAAQQLAKRKLGEDQSSAIDTIIASGKFSKDQVRLMRKSVSNGDDPLTVIKNQAKNLMGQTVADKVMNFEVAKDTIKSIDTDLAEFYKNGGDTSLFKGNYEKVLNNLGKVSDPKLVELATQIASSLQVYRNAVSGTAYSTQEGADIASIFPGINKSQGLNKAITNGRLKAFDSSIDASYRSVLGNVYDKVKPVDLNASGEGMSQIPATTNESNSSFFGGLLNYFTGGGKTSSSNVYDANTGSFNLPL